MSKDHSIVETFVGWISLKKTHLYTETDRGGDSCEKAEDKDEDESDELCAAERCGGVDDKNANEHD